MRFWTMLHMVVVLCSLTSVARSDPPSGIEAEPYERATKLSHLGRRGEAVKILRGLQSPLAIARLALAIAKDDVDSRLLGITTFDPNLAARLAKEAIRVLRRDVEKNAESASVLAGLYWNGVGVKEDQSAAFKLYLSAAERGYARAMGMASGCYFDGTGVTRDKRKGLEWLKLAVDRGDIHSMVILGERYEYGDDGPKNPTLGFQLCEKAAKAGSIFGMRACARVLRDRQERALEKKDLRASLTYGASADDWLRRAAEAGDARSMWELANYMRVALPSPSPEEAFHLYSEAADSGVSFTLLPLGACYLEGKGTVADPEKGIDLLKKAETAAKREGNDKAEAIAHKVLAEKTQEGRINLLRHEIGWSSDDFASFVGPGDVKTALGGPPHSSKSSRKAIRSGRPPVAPPVRPNVQLVLTDAVVNLSPTGNSVYVEGRFRNVSSKMLEFLRISVTFEDSSGKMVTTGRTYSEPASLPPGATGTFTVIEASDTRFAGVKLDFSCDNQPVEWQDESGKRVHQ